MCKFWGNIKMDLKRPGSENVAQDKDKFGGWRVVVKYVIN
jgi:hypothetical protein